MSAEMLAMKEKSDCKRQMVTAIVVGCGQRGQCYAAYSLEFPDRLKIVGVAEPKSHIREKMRKTYGLNDDQVFKDWKAISEQPKMADAAFVCTQDKMHLESSCSLAKKGYHLLLEKPMSVVEKECDEMAEIFRENAVYVAICHVLRYFPPCRKIKEIIDCGILGEISTIDHRENIGYWHFAHSFVRGNWRNEKEATFSLLAKSCHDVDLITFWMGNQGKWVQVQSFGSLQHFKKSKAPNGAGSTCFECPKHVEKACPYSINKIYLKDPRPVWPMAVVCDIEDDPRGYEAALRDSLRKGPYGRCVYNCDNDVVDHQVVQFYYDSGATVSFTMNAFTSDIRRETRICGSLGELRWDGNQLIEVFIFNSGKVDKDHDLLKAPQGPWGHGGADFFLVNEFVNAVASNDEEWARTGLDSALESHKLVFAAERSRLEKRIINA